MKRGAFNGCVRYVMEKQDAKLLDADGVLLENIDSIIASFHTQRLMKPNIKHPVGHISLSYSLDDKDKLTDVAMIKLAREYMQEMKIKDTQYIIVRHFDNDNPHVHLIYNRIDNNGRTISDKNDRYRNEAICKKLKDKYGLTYGKGKEKVKQHKLRGKDKTKYEIYSIVKGNLSKSTNWQDFTRRVKEKGVNPVFKFKGQTNEVQGISFEKNGVSFKGSEIDRNFSFSKLDKWLKQNVSALEHKLVEQSPNKIQSTRSDDSNISLRMSFEQHGVDYEEEAFARKGEYEQEKINRKNKRKSRGI